MTPFLRKLTGFAALFVVLLVAQIVLLRTCGPAYERWRLIPRGAFVPQHALWPDAYAEPAMWFARPDITNGPQAFLPPDMPFAPSVAPADRAYVFFVPSSSYFSRAGWNAPLDHADSQARARNQLRTMASVFSAIGRVWAPRYRQAAYGAFLSTTPAARAALMLAEGDVALALDRFIATLPPDVPIVLAGHQQGALILMRLFRDRIAHTPLARRIVALYLPGWPVSPVHDLPRLGMGACAGPDSTGCVMSWMSYRTPADPAMALDGAAWFPALDGWVGRRDRPVCTNPLNGGSAVAADPATNIGSLTIGDETGPPRLVHPSVGATCDPVSGVLDISPPPHLGDLILPGNNYAAYDYALFWRNLRGDVARRLAAWNHLNRGAAKR